MANGVHKITEDFESKLTDYTGAPFAVALDNCSNALFLSLYYENIKGKEIIDEGKKKIEKVKEKVTEKVGEIAKTPEGFEAFCLKNGYTPDGFGGMTGRTKEKNSLLTNDWYWDTSSNTFKPF